MDQPLHDFKPYAVGHAQSHRFVSFGAVALLHVIAIYGLASGLIQGLASKLPQELKAEVIPPKTEQVKPPPPPPPDLQKPPPPFVPPPEINIQSEAPVQNSITVQSKVASLPPPPKAVAPKPAGITAPISLKSSHNCLDRYYPPIAVRLNQTGTTRVRITVSADGQVTNASVSESSGHDSLDQAAIKCVTSGSWGGYKPAMQNGAAIAAQTEVDIVWKLQ